MSSLNFYVGISSLASYFKWKAWNVTASSSIIQADEWVTVTLQWTDVNSAFGTYSLSANGVPSTTTGFTDMMFQVIDDAAGTVTAHLQSVEIIQDTTTTFPNGVVSITFDDSWQSVHDLARPVMDSYGYRGTTYTIADSVDTPARLSMANLRAVQDFSGWEVAGHAYTNAAHGTRYTNMTAEQVDNELRNLKSWLVTNEFTSDAFAYPGGQFGPTTDGVPVDQLVGRYFNSGRSINYLNTTEMFPAAMPRRMRALSSISGNISAGDPANVTKLTSNGGLLDRCQLSGSWLILTFHEIVSDSESAVTQCSLANFQSVMAGINSRGIPVLPVGDVIRNYA
ncbi:polysaccharide deacetylase family protein [Streptomyces sp. CA-288835]|uniref:polysaccharide deacetylase family protein n=1 Tax=Streptomyces sp. CA-288835 TaxID=3240069 RepID=UPI003D8C502B